MVKIKKKQHCNRNEKCFSWAHEKTGHWWRENQWAWVYSDIPVKLKGEEKERNALKKRQKHPRTIVEYRKVKHIHNRNTRIKKRILEIIVAENIPKLITDTKLEIQRS